MSRFLCVGLFLFVQVVAAMAAPSTKVTPLLVKDLQGIPGKEGAMFLVEYPPGGSDPVHRHDSSVFVYVLDGSVEMQVRGGKRVILKRGQTFFEGPDDVHVVGRNVSQTRPARFIAFFVKNAGAPVVMPAH
jgi:quercetin dioxygenase-like cupin family protein